MRYNNYMRLRHSIIRLIIVLPLTLALQIVAWGGDLQKGIDAYHKGDYAAALRMLQPLAHQGNAKAQRYFKLAYDKAFKNPKNRVTVQIRNN